MEIFKTNQKIPNAKFAFYEKTQSELIARHKIRVFLLFPKFQLKLNFLFLTAHFIEFNFPAWRRTQTRKIIHFHPHSFHTSHILYILPTFCFPNELIFWKQILQLSCYCITEQPIKTSHWYSEENPYKMTRRNFLEMIKMPHSSCFFLIVRNTKGPFS